MADDLKRVGLVFKADGTVDFAKSLKEVNSSIQENRSAFKLAQSQWDENTKSIDKLKDKQKYLADQTRDYSDKVKMLQGELKELENREKTNADKIQSKREQLEKAKSTTESYKKKCDELKAELERIASEENANEEAVKKKREQLEKAEKSYLDYSLKVEKIEEDIDELNKKEANNAAAINKKKDQLNQAQTSLNNYKKGLEEVEDKLKSGTAEIEEYTKKIESFGKKSTDIGKKLSTGITTPIAAIGALSIKAVMELDEGYDIITKKTGATGEALTELNEVADNLFGKMPITMSDAGTAVGEINTRFGATGEILEEMSEKFLQFAEINGTDLNNSIAKADKIMEQYNIDASETGNVLGLITKKGQETGISVDSLMDSLQKNGPVFKEMGLNMAQSTNLLAQFEKNGVNADTAVAGLRKSLKTYTDEGKSVDEALKLTIEQIKNASDETKALSVAQEVFGTKGAAEMATAIREGRIDLESLTSSMEEYGQTVEDTYNATLDPWDEMTVATNNLKEAGSELAGSLFEVLAPIIELLTGKVKEFANWFSNLDEKTKKSTVTIGLIIAAIGPLLIILGTVAGSTSKIITLTSKTIGIMGKVPGVLSKVGTGAKALWGIMAANPIVAIIMGIMALIAIFVTLYNKCEWFRDGVNAIAQVVADFFTKTLPNAGKIAMDWFAKNWKNLLLFLVNPFVGGFKLLYDNCEGFRNFIDGIIDKIGEKFGKIGKFFRGIGEDIKDVWNAVRNAIKLPHFKVFGKFSLTPPSAPKLSVDWYAKGVILNRPTLFGMNGDRLMGGGEAGAEAVLPIELLKRYIREENNANNSILAQIIRQAISELQIVAENNIYIGDKKLVNMLTDMVIKKISGKVNDSRKVMGVV